MQEHFLIRKLTSCWSLDQMVMFGSLYYWVSTLPIVMSIHLLQVEICIFFVPWLSKTTPLRYHAYLWARASQKFGDHRHSDSWEEKCFIKNMNLINTYCHWKTELIGQPLDEKKMSNTKIVHFEKKCPEIKTYFYPYDYLLQLYS